VANYVGDIGYKAKSAINTKIEETVQLDGPSFMCSEERTQLQQSAMLLPPHSLRCQTKKKKENNKQNKTYGLGSHLH